MSRLRWIFRRFRVRRSSPQDAASHPLEPWMTQELERLLPQSPLSVTVIAMAVTQGKRLSVEDPKGLIHGLSRHLGIPTRQAFLRCVELARQGNQLGRWRLFLVDETLMGKKYQKLMVSGS